MRGSGTLTIHVSRETAERSIKEAVDEVVRAEVLSLLVDNDAFRAHIRNVVNAEVAAQAPGNPRIQEVIREVQEHLDRYPAIAHDVGLQEAVGKAIFTYLQGGL